MKAMILAAGLGTRLRPYSLLRPKPLFPVMGVPLLLRTINQLRAAGFAQIIVNAYHLADQMVALLSGQADIILQCEPMELGTGGGMRMALGHFGDEPVLITNGDIYHDIDYGAIYARHLAAGCQLTMVMHDYPRFNKVKVCAGLVRAFSKRGPEAAPGHGDSDEDVLAFTGIHVLQPSLLHDIPPSCFYSIIDRYQGHLDKGGMIQAAIVTGHFWKDIGTPEDYLDLHQALLSDSQPCFCLADGVKVGQDVIMEDWGYVGDGVCIGDGAHLTRVVVWDGAIIPNGAVLKDCLVANAPIN